MKITRWRIDNYNEREFPLDMIIIHATDTNSVQESVDCFLKNDTSIHYIVDRNGEIFSLVPENKRAWHSGTNKSFWLNRDDINSRSIGIEFQAKFPFHFTDIQLKNGYQLLKDILQRNPSIKPHFILGHSDIAPHRKEDPGVFFPWKEYAQKGIGLFPQSLEKIHSYYKNNTDVGTLLKEIGYACDLYGTTLCEKAFSNHFIGNSGKDFLETLYSVHDLFIRSYHAQQD